MDNLHNKEDYSKFKEFFEISQKTIEFNKSLNWDNSIKNVYLATTISELIEVYKIRSQIYKKMGYSVEFKDIINGLNFDKYDTHSAILYTKRDGKVTGTCRLIFDIDKNLPLDKKYSLNFLREQNKTLVELSRLVIKQENKGLSQEPRLLVKGSYIVMKLNNISTLTSVMVKEHFRYYKKFGGFKEEDKIDSFGKIKQPFIITSWDIKDVSPFFTKLFLR